MYKQVIAVFAATSALFMSNAGTVRADDDEKTVRAPQCSDDDRISINVSPPPPLTGDVRAKDIKDFLGSIVAGTPLHGLFTLRPHTATTPEPPPPASPSPTPASSGAPSPAASGLTGSGSPR